MVTMLVLPLILLAALPFGNAMDKCSYEIDGQKYSRTLVLEIHGLPTNIAYNNNTGDLFFTLIDEESLLNDDVQTKMDLYVIRNGVHKIYNINGQTAAVDKARGVVYFGSDSGLHVFNGQDNNAVYVGMEINDITQLFNSPGTDNLYAILHPSNEVYRISKDGEVKDHIEEIPCTSILAVDSSENIYFQSESKVISVLLNGFKEPISYVGLKPDAGRVLAADGDRMLAATYDGLYVLSPDNVIPKKIADFDFIPTGLDVYNDDMYVSTSGKIFKFSKC